MSEDCALCPVCVRKGAIKHIEVKCGGMEMDGQAIVRSEDEMTQAEWVVKLGMWGAICAENFITDKKSVILESGTIKSWRNGFNILEWLHQRRNGNKN